MLVEIILGLKKSSTKGALGRGWVNLKIFSIRKKYSRTSTNGHLSTTTTSLQRPPRYNGHLATTATSLQRPPLHNGHLATTATSLQQPLFLADSPYIHFCFNLSPMATLFCPQGGHCREAQLYSFSSSSNFNREFEKIATRHEFLRVSFH